MEHLAILEKKRKLLTKILTGEKTIESRWYKSKVVPWGNIKAGETIYFKESGDPVRARATVSEVMQFYLPQTDIPDLLEKYAKEICFTNPMSELIEWCSQRKYSILIRLKKVELIEPFEIDKKGFGLMAAWITVDKIENIKR
jgi:hypothetical protein